MMWPSRKEVWGNRFLETKQDYVTVARAIRQFEPVTMVVGAGDRIYGKGVDTQYPLYAIVREGKLYTSDGAPEPTDLDNIVSGFKRFFSVPEEKSVVLGQEAVHIGDAQVEAKADDSPLTRADLDSHRLLLAGLALAMAATARNVPLDAACSGLLWAWLENQIAAALKAFPMGQTAGQRVFQHLVNLIPDWYQQSLQVGDEQIGLSVPGVVMASMQHENQYSRLFRS